MPTPHRPSAKSHGQEKGTVPPSLLDSHHYSWVVLFSSPFPRHVLSQSCRLPLPHFFCILPPRGKGRGGRRGSKITHFDSLYHPDSKSYVAKEPFTEPLGCPSVPSLVYNPVSFPYWDISQIQGTEPHLDNSMCLVILLKCNWFLGNTGSN